MKDFGVLTEIIPLLCDNTSAINIAKNIVQHEWMKHINVRHHLLGDNVEHMNVLMWLCNTEDQLPIIFPKPLWKESFFKSRLRLTMVNLTWLFNRATERAPNWLCLGGHVSMFLLTPSTWEFIICTLMQVYTHRMNNLREDLTTQNLADKTRKWPGPS